MGFLLAFPAAARAYQSADQRGWGIAAYALLAAEIVAAVVVLLRQNPGP